MGCLNSNDASQSSKNKVINGFKNNRIIVKQAQIAHGAYGQVWKCLDPNTKQIFALKSILLQVGISQMIDQIIRSNVSERVQSAEDSCIVQSKLSKGFPTGCLLLEFSHMNLFQETMINILEGLKQLHNLNIFHLDVKPENIVLIQDKYKLCDFGSCIQKAIDFKRISKRQKNQIEEFIQSNSTLMYRSPEMIDTTGKVLNEKTDVWMVGLVGYLMLYRKHPFENQGKMAILAPIKYTSQGQIQNLFKKMLTIDQNQRASVDQSLQMINQILSTF